MNLIKAGDDTVFNLDHVVSMVLDVKTGDCIVVTLICQIKIHFPHGRDFFDRAQRMASATPILLSEN